MSFRGCFSLSRAMEIHSVVVLFLLNTYRALIIVSDVLVLHMQ